MGLLCEKTISQEHLWITIDVRNGDELKVVYDVDKFLVVKKCLACGMIHDRKEK